MTKLNELLTASPLQFAAVFGAIPADSGPAPINARPPVASRPGYGGASLAARGKADSKISGPVGTPGSGVSTRRP
jgi:hypothetical protein